MLSSILFAFSAAAIASVARAQDINASGINCIPMCLQVKFVEADTLAPKCASSDIACLCSTPYFGNAYRRCLSDNCASSNETATGVQVYDQICADAGVATKSLPAQTDEGSKETAVAVVESLLGASISGTPVSQLSFQPDSALAFASAFQSSQQSIATASAISAYSHANAIVESSLDRQASRVSASFQQIVRGASATQAALQSALPSSEFASAAAQISSSLDSVKAAATSQLDAARASAEASLASESASFFPVSANLTDTQANAVSSAASRSSIQAGLGLFALTLVFWLS